MDTMRYVVGGATLLAGAALLATSIPEEATGVLAVVGILQDIIGLPLVLYGAGMLGLGSSQAVVSK